MEIVTAKGLNKTSVSQLLGRLAIAAILTTAAAAKLSSFREFESTLLVSRLLFPGAVSLFAALFIITEFALAASLFIRAQSSAPLQVTQFLFCLFLSYSLWRWWQNIPVPCSCFGPLFTLHPGAGILLNFSLLSLAMALEGSTRRLTRSQSVRGCELSAF